MPSVQTSLTKVQIQLSSQNYQLLSNSYDRYSNSLFGIILKFTPDYATAETILHDAFLTMATSEYFFKAENDIKRFSCMTAIIINQCQVVLSLPKQVIVKTIFASLSIIHP